MKVHSTLRAARLSSWMYRMISTVVGVLVVRMINERIGLAGYGDVAFMLSCIGGISSFDLGFLQSLSRFVAKNSADSYEQQGLFWANCVLLLVGIFILQVVILVVFTVLLRENGRLHEYSFCDILYVGVLMVLGNLLFAGSSVYAGWQKYGPGGMSKISGSVLYLVSVFTLWYFDILTRRSVFWSYALIALVPNMLVGLVLLLRNKSKMMWRWDGFPVAHLKKLQEMISYSLRGWLFTASNIMINNGTVFAAGLIISGAFVGKIQLALTLYTGVAVFVTGAMTPLSTIRARYSDYSYKSIKIVAEAAHTLIEESVLLTAILLVFFLFHIRMVLELLLGKQIYDSVSFTQITAEISIVLLPALAVLPWFTYRFVLVSHDENKKYSQQLFVGTLFVLSCGMVVSMYMGNPVAALVSVSIGLVYRGLLAYWLGRKIFPGIRGVSILLLLVIALFVCTVLNLLSLLLKTGWHYGDFGDIHLQAALYMLLCAILYLGRSYLRPLLGLRNYDYTRHSLISRIY